MTERLRLFVDANDTRIIAVNAQDVLSPVCVMDSQAPGQARHYAIRLIAAYEATRPIDLADLQDDIFRKAGMRLRAAHERLDDFIKAGSAGDIADAVYARDEMAVILQRLKQAANGVPG